MAIGDICTREVIFIDVGKTMQFAAVLMRKHHVGALVVIEPNGSKRPVGFITDRDIALHVVAEGISPGATVERYMSKNIASVSENEGIGNAIQEMQHKGVRRLVVTNHREEVVGIVSTDDVIRLLGMEMYNLGRLVNRELKNEAQKKTGRRDYYVS